MERNVYDEPVDRLVIRTKDVTQSQTEVGVDAYTPELLSIVANLDNTGAPEGYNCISGVGSSKRGTIFLRLFARADYEHARFEAVGFKAHGCLALIAAGSVICHLIENHTWKEALAVKPEDILKIVKDVPWDKTHTIYFAIEATRALVGDCLFRADQKLAFIEDYVGCDDKMMECMLCEHCSLRSTRSDLRYQEFMAAQEAKQQEEAQ